MRACMHDDRQAQHGSKAMSGLHLARCIIDHTTHMHKAITHHAHVHVHVHIPVHILTTPAQTSLASNPLVSYPLVTQDIFIHSRKSSLSVFPIYAVTHFLVPHLSLNLLALELGQARRDIGPLLLAVDQADDGAGNLLEPAAHLLRRVTVAQRKRVVLDRLEVDRDAKGRAQLVVALLSPLALYFPHSKTRIKLTE
jgi:hypothetical protein